MSTFRLSSWYQVTFVNSFSSIILLHVNPQIEKEGKKHIHTVCKCRLHRLILPYTWNLVSVSRVWNWELDSRANFQLAHFTAELPQLHFATLPSTPGIHSLCHCWWRVNQVFWGEMLSLPPFFSQHFWFGELIQILVRCSVSEAYAE